MIAEIEHLYYNNPATSDGFFLVAFLFSEPTMPFTSRLTSLPCHPKGWAISESPRSSADECRAGTFKRDLFYEVNSFKYPHIWCFYGPFQPLIPAYGGFLDLFLFFPVDRQSGQYSDQSGQYSDHRRPKSPMERGKAISPQTDPLDPLKGIRFMKSNHFCTPIYSVSSGLFAPLPPHMVVFWIRFFFFQPSSFIKSPVLWLQWLPMTSRPASQKTTPTSTGLFSGCSSGSTGSTTPRYGQDTRFNAIHSHIWEHLEVVIFSYDRVSPRSPFLTSILPSPLFVKSMAHCAAGLDRSTFSC
jgi:hypothetical protein